MSVSGDIAIYGRDKSGKPARIATHYLFDWNLFKYLEEFSAALQADCPRVFRFLATFLEGEETPGDIREDFGKDCEFGNILLSFSIKSLSSLVRQLQLVLSDPSFHKELEDGDENGSYLDQMLSWCSVLDRLLFTLSSFEDMLRNREHCQQDAVPATLLNPSLDPGKPLVAILFTA